MNEDEARKEKYGDVLPTMASIYKDRAPGIVPLIYASLTGVGGSGIVQYAGDFTGLQTLMQQQKEEKDKAKKAKKQEQIDQAVASLKESMDQHFKDYDAPTDEEVLAVMTQLYLDRMAPELQPEYLTKLTDKFDGDMYAMADYVFNTSFLSDPDKVMAFLDDPSLKVIDKDPAFQLYEGFMAKIMEAQANYNDRGGEMKTAQRLWEKGVREMQPDKKFYPDANSTMRFTYGTVQDYDARDAVHYDYVTHLSGVMEKEDPENDEFIVPAKLKELYETKDYGPYASKDGRMDVCFLTNNDITGGNSGSPVINAKGELIGLAFDGNWEAMSSDIAFAPKLQRTIVVDVRYVLFIIDKFAGAGHLVDELEIHKTMPQPIRTEKTQTAEPVMSE